MSGVWTGPDGKSVIAALNPGGYTGGLCPRDLSKEPAGRRLRGQRSPMSNSPNLRRSSEHARSRPRQFEQDWVKRIDMDGKLTGVYADYHYVGTGDIGGATPEASIKLLEAIETSSATILPPRAIGSAAIRAHLGLRVIFLPRARR